MKDLKALETLNEAIKALELSVQYQQAKINRWHASGHDWHIPEFSFFDLAEAEKGLYQTENSLTDLRAGFNRVLETLKY